MLVECIVQHRERFGVEPISGALRRAGMQIAPTSYFAAKTRPASASAVADGKRLEVIRAAHQEDYGVYGVRKMRAELNRRATGSPGAPCTASCAPDQAVALHPPQPWTRPRGTSGRRCFA